MPLINDYVDVSSRAPRPIFSLHPYFLYTSSEGSGESVLMLADAKSTKITRLTPVLKTIFHKCAISYTCSYSYSDGSVLKQSHQSKTSYKYMIWHIDEKLY